MIEEFKEIISALDNPSMKHAVFGHLPIALCILLIPLTLAAALLRSNRTCRIMAICAFGLLLISSYLTVNTGERAEEAINKVLTREVYELLEEHEAMAEKLWFFAIAGLILLAVSDWVGKPGLRTAGLWLAVVVSIAAFAWVSVTAHHGGTLVYSFGVGTPMPVGPQEIRTPRPGTGSSADSDSDARIAFFKQTAFPILSENCFKCHNPAKVAAGKSSRLDLTSREAMMRGGESGPAIIAGQPDDSLLMQRVAHPDPEEVMPPDHPLAPEDIAALRKWIAEGAFFE